MIRAMRRRAGLQVIKASICGSCRLEQRPTTQTCRVMETRGKGFAVFHPTRTEWWCEGVGWITLSYPPIQAGASAMLKDERVDTAAPRADAGNRLNRLSDLFVHHTDLLRDTARATPVMRLAYTSASQGSHESRLLEETVAQAWRTYALSFAGWSGSSYRNASSESSIASIQGVWCTGASVPVSVER